MRVLNNGRDLESKLLGYWPKSWQAVKLLKVKGYKEPMRYDICLNREHVPVYDIIDSSRHEFSHICICTEVAIKRPNRF